MAVSGEHSTNGSIRIPSWFQWVVAAAVAVFSAGWAAATTIRRDSTDLDVFRQTMVLELQTISTRLCRLERASKVEPWESCK